jgi:hypothetical protein
MTTSHRFERWPLAREITLVLLIKLILLLAIWLVCFRHPVDRELEPSDVAKVLLSSAPNKSDKSILYTPNLNPIEEFNRD